jgi:hypothetical protein
MEDDIPKLAGLKEPLENRYILLFDEANYLEKFDTTSNKPKLNRIIQVRDKLDPRIKIIHVKK